MRRQAEAAEARGADGEVVEGEVEEVEEDEEADADAEVDAEVDAEADEDDDGEVKKKPAKKKAAKKPAVKKATVKKPAVKRVRTVKEPRRRAMWVVFDNASKRVETFPFGEKAEAEAFLAKKIEEKEGKSTFYLNLVKDEIAD